jgi:hypothetical protein
MRWDFGRDAGSRRREQGRPANGQPFNSSSRGTREGECARPNVGPWTSIGRGEERRAEETREQGALDAARGLHEAEALAIVPSEPERHENGHGHERHEPSCGAEAVGAGDPVKLPAPPRGGDEEGNTQRRDAESLEVGVAFGDEAEALKIGRVVLLVVREGTSLTGLC